MSLTAKMRRAPLRAVTGAYFLNSGISKLSADEATAKGLHGAAMGTYPFVGKVQPKMFARGLAMSEIAVGSVVLLPVVPPLVAGAALMGFSGALLNLYWRTPGMHEEGSPRPTEQGVPIAKDIWLFGIGTGLVADALLEPAHDKKVEIGATVSEKRAEKSRRARRKAAKKASRAAHSDDSDHLKQAREAAAALQVEAAKRATRAAKKARKRAEKASEVAAKRLADARADYAPVAVEKAKAARVAARSAVDEYGPVAAEKAKIAREAARSAIDEYGPVAAEKTTAAREAARSAIDEYSTIAAEKARQAKLAAEMASSKARERLAG